jgi:hypothetical protein
MALNLIVKVDATLQLVSCVQSESHLNEKQPYSTRATASTPSPTLSEHLVLDEDSKKYMFGLNLKTLGKCQTWNCRSVR